MFNIPMPKPFNDYLSEASSGITGILQKARAHALEQQKLEELKRQHALEMELKKSQAGRAAKLLPLRELLLKAQAQKAASDAQWNNMLLGGNNNSGATNANDITNASANSVSASDDSLSNSEADKILEQSAIEDNPLQSAVAPVPLKNEFPEEKKEFPHYAEGETVVSPGNPNLEHINQYAGIKNIPKLQTHYENGVLTTIYPNQKVTVRKIGPSNEEVKFNVKTYGNAVEAAQSLDDRSANLQNLVQQLNENPNASQVIGPINKSLTQLFGRPEDQAFLGAIMAPSGNIVLEAAKNIKGAFTGRDQTLINGMKPNPSDPYWVFVGKLKALGELTDLAHKRMNKYAKFVHSGLDPIDAMEKAKKETSMEPKEKTYENMLALAKARSDLQENRMPLLKTKEQKAALLESLTLPEKQKLLSLASSYR